MTAPDGEQWTWSARNSLVVHLADPIQPELALCGVPASHLAKDDQKSQPALRCLKCAKVIKETRSG